MSRVAALTSTLSGRRDIYNRRAGQRDAVLGQHQYVESELQRQDAEIKLNEQVRYLLQKISEQARESARKTLEDTVTSALQYIFGSDYRFVIEIEQKGGRTEAEFYVESPAPGAPGEFMRLSPEDSRGGGIVDIVGLALRLAVMRIHSDPKVADVLIMDEPGKHVSLNYSHLLADFLKWASSYFHMQVIMVTHNEDLAAVADQSFLVQQTDGTSHFAGGTSNAER